MYAGFGVRRGLHHWFSWDFVTDDILVKSSSIDEQPSNEIQTAAVAGRRVAFAQEARRSSAAIVKCYGITAQFSNISHNNTILWGFHHWRTERYTAV